MPSQVRVRLLPAGQVITLRTGERVLDAIDEQLEPGGSGLPTACRAANCGLCLVWVRKGAAALEAALPEEAGLLARLGVASGQRLGCQLAVAAGSTAMPTPAEGYEIVLEAALGTARPGASR